VARKWKISIGVWIAILLYFGIGQSDPRDADLLLVIFYSALLVAVSVFAVLAWVRDRKAGSVERSYHLTGYPRSFLLFAFDEPEDKQAKHSGRQSQDEESN